QAFGPILGSQTAMPQIEEPPASNEAAEAAKTEMLKAEEAKAQAAKAEEARLDAARRQEAKAEAARGEAAKAEAARKTAASVIADRAAAAARREQENLAKGLCTVVVSIDPVPQVL